MRPARLFVIALVVLCLFLPLAAKSNKLIVTGTLEQVMAIGGESTGWAIQLNPVIIVGGRQISSLELKSPDTHKLASLREKFVQAKGTLTTVQGVETGDRPVLELSSIHVVKTNNPQNDKNKLSFWDSVANFFSLSPT
jgi:hypothetical protein